MSPTPTPRTLLVHFSRPGEDYSSGGRTNLEVGNTEVLAGMIAELIDCDVHRIGRGHRPAGRGSHTVGVVR